MANEGVLSGYYGICKPPYSILNPVAGGSIYMVTSQYRNQLILLPLITNFYVDFVKIIKRWPSQKVFFIAPDMGPAFISDYLASWNYCKNINIPCKIFTYKKPTGDHLPEDFLANVIKSKNQHESFTVNTDNDDVSTVRVNFVTLMVQTASDAVADIAIYDNNKRRLFVNEMNESKLVYLNEHDMYDEIHIPYIIGTYPTMSYKQCVKTCPKMAKYLVVDRLGGKEEKEDAEKNQATLGRLITL